MHTSSSTPPTREVEVRDCACCGTRAHRRVSCAPPALGRFRSTRRPRTCPHSMRRHPRTPYGMPSIQPSLRRRAGVGERGRWVRGIRALHAFSQERARTRGRPRLVTVLCAMQAVVMRSPAAAPLMTATTTSLYCSFSFRCPRSTGPRLALAHDAPLRRTQGRRQGEEL